MKKIKFKGKSKETNEWVCGQLLYLDNQPFIVGDLVEANSEYTNLEWWQPVYPNSVGQFTGVEYLDVIGNIYDNPELLKEESE